MRFDEQSLQNVSTICAHFGEDPRQYAGAVVPPVFSNSLFTFETIEQMRDVCSVDDKPCSTYTRESNPTVAIAERKIAALEGAERARLFGSGMAAITSAILSCLKGKDHVICVQDVYPSTRIFLTDYMARFGVTTTVVSGDSVAEIESAIRPETTLIYLESPTSLTYKLQDIRAITALAKRHGIQTIIDNTWATPVFQKPLAMGVDLVVHSASKYLGGHSGIVAGVVAGSAERIAALTKNEAMTFGGILGPFEAYLLTMGMRTLELRMAQHQKNAMAVAQFLSGQKRVRQIYYPGLPSSPYYSLGRAQMSGYSGVMSFDLDCSRDDVARFIDAFEMPQIGVSWGGFESLVYAPSVVAASNKVDEEHPTEAFSQTKVRTSVGLENVDDILHDFERAFSVLK